jgi:hypothetical protein
MATFLELTRELAADDAAKDEFGADAEGFLAARGWSGLDEAELADALSHAVDALPATTAAQLPTSEALSSGTVRADTALQRLAEADPPAALAPAGDEPADAPDTGAADGDEPAVDAEADPDGSDSDPDFELDTTYEIEDETPDWAEEATSHDDGSDGSDGFDSDGIDPSSDQGDAFDFG